VNPRRLLSAALTAGVVLLVVVAGYSVFSGLGHRTMRLSAHFAHAVGVYTGSDVRVLGVSVGRITKVTPDGTTVRVDMEYDAKYHVPANASAVIVPPSVVSDRYVQLTPVYRGGPRMRDGGDIPLARTVSPVELDEIYQNLNDLNVALGPQGANSNGALNRLLKVGADNLGGQGQRLHTTVHDFSVAITTLDDNKTDLFGTVRNLEQFTAALAASDQQVRRFNADLAGVSEQLAGENDELGAALHDLSIALAQVATFVRTNKKLLVGNVAGLAEVTGVLVAQRVALAKVLDEAPLALSNLNLAYNPSSGTLDTRDNPLALGLPGLDQVLCGALAANQALLTALKLPKPNCAALSPAALGQLIQSVRNRIGGAKLPLKIPLLPGSQAPGLPALGPPATGAAPAPAGLPVPTDSLDKTLGGILAVVP